MSHIFNFTEGQVLVRTERSSRGDGSFMGDPMLFLGQVNNELIFQKTDMPYPKGEGLRKLSAEDYRGGWALYQSPNKLITPQLVLGLMERLNPDKARVVVNEFLEIFATETKAVLDDTIAAVEQIRADAIQEALHDARKLKINAAFGDHSFPMFDENTSEKISRDGKINLSNLMRGLLESDWNGSMDASVPTTEHSITSQFDLEEILDFLATDNKLSEKTIVSVESEKNLTTYTVDVQLSDDQAMELHGVISSYLRRLNEKGE